MNENLILQVVIDDARWLQESPKRLLAMRLTASHRYSGVTIEARRVCVGTGWTELADELEDRGLIELEQGRARLTFRGDNVLTYAQETFDPFYAWTSER